MSTRSVPTRWAMSTPRLLTPRLDVYEYVPENLQAADGSLLIAHIAGPSHHAPGGRRAVIRRSTDGATTWTVVLNLQGGSGELWANEGLTLLPDGTLLALMSRATTHDNIELVRMYRSDDHGQTWDRLGPDYPWQAATFGNLTQLEDGSLLTSWHGDGWGMAGFDADGLGGEIWSTANGGRWGMEMRLASAPGLGVLGTGRHSDGLLLFKSVDGGATWEWPADTGLPNLTEGFTDTGDLRTMVTLNRATQEIELREASLTELWDDATDWSPPRHLTSVHGYGWYERGYPDLTLLDTGDIFLTWYSGDRRPGVMMATLTTDAARLRAADRQAIRRQGFQALPAAKTFDSDTPGVTYVHGIVAPIMEEAAQRGPVYLRVNARVKGTPGVTARLTFGCHAAEPVVTLDVPLGGTWEHPKSSGWIPVPTDYTGNTGDGYGMLTLRCHILGAGTVTLSQATTIEIGAQE